MLSSALAVTKLLQRYKLDGKRCFGTLVIGTTGKPKGEVSDSRIFHDQLFTKIAFLVLDLVSIITNRLHEVQYISREMYKIISESIGETYFNAKHFIKE